MHKRRTTWVVSGSFLGVLGITLTIVALTPTQWASTVSAWALLARYVFKYLIVALSSAALTLTIVRWRQLKNSSSSVIQILSADEYVTDFRRELQMGYSIVKVFGFTGEVVNNDLIRYADRYNSAMQVRFLHRNWLVEKLDEDLHNEAIQGSGLRPWRKATAIKGFAKSSWAHALSRDMRYYAHQPLLSATLLARDAGLPQIAYVGFHEWQRYPRSGGSQFKSVPAVMMKVISNKGPAEAEFVGRVDSQFEYEWIKGKSVEEIERNTTPGDS